MLVLYETALGYCLFKLTDDGKVNNADLYKEFQTPEQANKLLVSAVQVASSFILMFFHAV